MNQASASCRGIPREIKKAAAPRPRPAQPSGRSHTQLKQLGDQHLGTSTTPRRLDPTQDQIARGGLHGRMVGTNHRGAGVRLSAVAGAALPGRHPGRLRDARRRARRARPLARTWTTPPRPLPPRQLRRPRRARRQQSRARCSSTSARASTWAPCSCPAPRPTPPLRDHHHRHRHSPRREHLAAADRPWALAALFVAGFTGIVRKT